MQGIRSVLCISVGVYRVSGFPGVVQSFAPIRRGEVCYPSARAGDAIALFKGAQHRHRVRSAIRTWYADLHVPHRSTSLGTIDGVPITHDATPPTAMAGR